MDEYQKAFNFILGASYMLISIFYFCFLVAENIL